MPRSTSAPKVRSNGKAEQRTLEVKGEDVYLYFETREYRVRGLQRNHSMQQLRVNVLARRDELVHLDTLDLYKAKSRASFIKATAIELYTEEATIKRDIGQMLLQLEQLQLDQIEAATQLEKPVELTAIQRRDALEFLRDSKLTDRILTDFNTCGLVGEETNKLICYLACVSRRLKSPLAILIQSSSAAGKTSLLDAALAFVPPEDQIRYSAMTGQSLYYMGRNDLKHKVLAIAEEEGVSQASYALKLLQSDGCLRIAAAGKNKANGRQETESYEVEGPVMMFLTTTQESPDEELRNRCLTLHVNESAAQTATIQSCQRQAYTLAGQKAATERSKLIELHQNAQRLLEPLPVVIPYAEQLAFRDDQTEMRREHAKYLSLIASITMLHQHQRKRRPLSGNEANEYLEATLYDVELANHLMTELMGQSIDELLPQTRQLLFRIDKYVAGISAKQGKPRSHIRFTQREIRETLGWGDFAIRRHLLRLVELEYVLAFRTGHGNQREYQLLYNSEQRNAFKLLPGLADPSQLVEPASSPKG